MSLLKRMKATLKYAIVCILFTTMLASSALGIGKTANSEMAYQKYLHTLKHYKTLNAVEIKIKSIFSQTNFDRHLADIAIYQLFTNKNIDRTQKLNFLWSMALNYKHDTIKFSYILYQLESIKPLELVPQLMSLYSRTRPIKNKKMIIHVLKNSAIFSGKDALKLKNMPTTLNKNIRNIKLFLEKIKIVSKTPAVKSYAIKMYDQTTSKHQSYNSNGNPWINSTKKAKKNQLAIALQSQTVQNNDLLALLAKYSNLPTVTRRNKNDLLYALILNKRTLILTPKNKIALRKYISQQRNEAMTPYHYNDLNSAKPYLQWLKAYAKISTNTLLNYQKFILNNICNLHDAYFKYALLSLLNTAILKMLTKEKITTLIYEININLKCCIKNGPTYVNAQAVLIRLNYLLTKKHL